MRRIERLTAIITFLQSRKFTPIERLKEKFGVCERTVYRDMASLHEIGVPISFEESRGYFILDTHFIPPVSFSVNEWHTVAFCWKRTEYRDFLISSILELKNTLLPFRIENHLTLDNYIKQL